MNNSRPSKFPFRIFGFPVVELFGGGIGLSTTGFGPEEQSDTESGVPEGHLDDGCAIEFDVGDDVVHVDGAAEGNHDLGRVLTHDGVRTRGWGDGAGIQTRRFIRN